MEMVRWLELTTDKERMKQWVFFNQKKKGQKRFLIKVFHYLEEITDKTESDSSGMERQEGWYRSCNRVKFGWTIKEK